MFAHKRLEEKFNHSPFRSYIKRKRLQWSLLARTNTYTQRRVRSFIRIISIFFCVSTDLPQNATQNQVQIYSLIMFPCIYTQLTHKQIRLPSRHETRNKNPTTTRHIHIHPPLDYVLHAGSQLANKPAARTDVNTQ